MNAKHSSRALFALACALHLSCREEPRPKPAPPLPSSSPAPRPPVPTVSRWVSPWPQGNSLRSLWIAPWRDLYAVGDGGTLVHRYERDDRWVVRELTDAALTAIWGDQDNIYVAGERGTLLISRDRGETWTTAASGTAACFWAVSGCGKEVFAVGSDGQFTHSRDAGMTWQADRTPGATPPRVETWPLYQAPDLTGVTCDVNGSVTAIVYSGAILTSKDHGATWKRRDVQPEELHTAKHPEGLAFVKLVRTPRELLVVSLIGVPARGQKLPTRRWANVLTLRGDRVEPWRFVEQLDNEVDAALDQAPLGARSVVVTPSGRAILVTDSGKYWAAPFDRNWHYVFRLQQARAAAQPEQFHDVAGDDRKLYAVGSSGSLGISTDAGKTWQLLRTPEDHFRAVWTDGQNALVAGDYVTISRDAGKTWSALRRVLGKVQLAGRGASAAGTEYYVAGDRGLSYSSDAGETFAAVDVGLAPNFRATGVWGRGTEPVLVVGGVHERSSGTVRSAVVLRAAGGRSELVLNLPWPEDEQENYAPAFACIHGNQERRVYAGGRRGLFVRSLDGGADWQQMPPFANGEQELCGLHAGNGDTLWALSATYRDCRVTQLWVSHDAGQTFELLEPPRPGADVSAIGGSPEGELLVAAGGRIFEQDPVTGSFSELTAGAHAASTRLLALAAPEPRRVLAVGHSGTILSVEPAP